MNTVVPSPYPVVQTAEFFETYGGKWIAVQGNHIVGVGDTALEAARTAQENVPNGDFVLEGVDRFPYDL